MKKIELKVDGMMCEGCENRVKNVLSNIKDINIISVSYKTNNVIIEASDDKAFSLAKAAIEELGYIIRK